MAENPDACTTLRPAGWAGDPDIDPLPRVALVYHWTSEEPEAGVPDEYWTWELVGPTDAGMVELDGTSTSDPTQMLQLILDALAGRETLPEYSLGHLVTLHAIHRSPNDRQVQEQWSGRLQGMAMAGLVWRFPGKPWRPSAHGRAVIAATAGHPRIVEIFGPEAS